MGCWLFFAAGFTTGFVVKSGAVITQCVPIFEGYCLPPAARLSGLGLTDYLGMLLKDHGSILLSAADNKIVTVVTCDVTMSYEEEMTKTPGGREFTNYLVGR